MAQNEQTPDSPPDQETWARDVLARLAFAQVAEQRRARRWGILFRTLILAYLVVVTGMVIWDARGVDPEMGKPHTAVVRVEGLIGPGQEANADDIVQAAKSAFEDDATRAVVLRINSPGGSPVQSAVIVEELRRLDDEHEDIPLYAVIEDLGASGGYFVAVAADQIYANRSSLVGSIGVRMAGGFGFVGAMDKLGITRRMYTAGEHKGFLDPFQPENPEEVAHLEATLEQVHQHFIDTVRSGRGERLGDHPDLFSGLIWTGEQAVELGLIDGLAGIRELARDKVGEERLVDYSIEEPLWQRIARRVETAAGRAFVALQAPSWR